MSDSVKQSKSPPDERRKKYNPPVLKEYGTMQDLTKGGGDPFDDAPGTRKDL